MRHLHPLNPMCRVMIALAGLLTLAVGPGASALQAVFITGGVYDEPVQTNMVDVEGTLDADPFEVSSGTFKSNVSTAFAAGYGGVIDFDSGSLTSGTSMDASFASATKSISITNSVSVYTGPSAFSQRTAISGNDFLAVTIANPDHDFNFGTITGGSPTEVVTSVGLTLLSRDNVSFTGSATAEAFFSGGTSTTQAITLTQGNGTSDTFIGFEAPDEESITRVTIDMPAGAFTGVDDLAFITTQFDGVIDYTNTTNGIGQAEDLTSVTVVRDGEELTFSASSLIGVEVTHFKADGADTRNFATEFDGTDPADDANPATTRAGLLDADDALYTGLFNPGGSASPLVSDPVTADPEVGGTNTPGLAFTFDEAVVNRPGPDVVLFELQTTGGPPTEGDGFHVSPLDFSGGLNSISIDAFDIQYDMPEAQLLAFHRLFDLDSAPTSLTDLESLGDDGGTNVDDPALLAKALAVGIDLSDLGYAEGALVSGLFIQDDLDDAFRIDLVYIAGLPANSLAEGMGVPEPSSLLLLGLLTTWMAVRKRSRLKQPLGRL